MNLDEMAEIKKLLTEMKIEDVHALLDEKIKDKLYNMYMNKELSVKPKTPVQTTEVKLVLDGEEVAKTLTETPKKKRSIN